MDKFTKSTISRLVMMGDLLLKQAIMDDEIEQQPACHPFSLQFKMHILRHYPAGVPICRSYPHRKLPNHKQIRGALVLFVSLSTP